MRVVTEVKKLLFIGGHGMLGRPVVRQMVKDGFEISVLARHPDIARQLLPPQVKVIQGDLRKIETVERGVEGVSAVYISLATKNHKAPFKTELDGTKQIVQALKRQKDIVIAKLSEIDVAPTSLFVDGVHKYRAEEEIKNSGHPYIIFRPTWFMESLPLFVKNNRFLLFGKQTNPLYWIAGQDYARMVSSAFKKFDQCKNRIFNIQGSEPLTFEEAAQRFINAYQPTIKITHVPLWVLKIPASFSPTAAFLLDLMKAYETHQESLKSENAWQDLGYPTMCIEDYVTYLKNTDELPKK